MPQTARDLVAYKSYTPTGTTDTKPTRKLTLDQEWVFGATGGVNLMIKFENNFFKKHLFTYSKKTAEVSQIAYDLSKADGDPPGKEFDYWLKAELTKLNQKLRKALEHRAEKYKCACGHYQVSHKCTTCHHEEIKHKTGSGHPTPCKHNTSAVVGVITPCACNVHAFRCEMPGCACTAFVDAGITGTYATQRSTSGKGPDNPLQGAATQLNTCIILDRITMENFKQVVIGSFETAETAAFNWPLNTQKLLTWNFGVANCIVNASLGQDSAAWTMGSSVQVLAEKTSFVAAGGGTPATHSYKVIHLGG